MTYVLDTNTFIAGLNGNATVLRRLGALNPEDIVLCALDATLVSDDRAFHDDPIPGLEIENWLIG